ncbi:MAG: NUDIX domain-containing protein [Gammaproteobacteria bacterium]
MIPAAIRASFAINILEDKDKQLLLLKRPPTAKLGAGLWGFPAGHIEEGETPLACSKRELYEEIGPGHEVKLLKSLGPIRDTFYGGMYEITLFHYRWEGGEVVLNKEHTAFAWVTRDTYREFAVMDGIDEDIAYFDIWPRSFLNPDKLPRGQSSA